jgi:PKHD-type hydroxylase
MLYKVIKAAFSADEIAEIHTRAATIPPVQGATVEHDEYRSRDCELRWFEVGTAHFVWLEKKLNDILRKNEIINPKLTAMEDIQYTVYGPGNFHSWHIDAYRRAYNQFDTVLGKQFVGKKREVSLSLLLNNATEFEGGAFEISLFPNGPNTVGTKVENFSVAGDIAIFDSALSHRVAPVTRGVRKSLVAWVCA